MSARRRTRSLRSDGPDMRFRTAEQSCASTTEDAVPALPHNRDVLSMATMLAFALRVSASTSDSRRRLQSKRRR